MSTKDMKIWQNVNMQDNHVNMQNRINTYILTCTLYHVHMITSMFIIAANM